MSNIKIQKDWKPSKAEIERIKNELIEQVQTGNINSLKSMAILKALSTAIEEAMEEIKQVVIEELQNYPKGQNAIVLCSEYQLKEAGVKYNYENCGDSMLLGMMAQRTVLDEQIKERQKFLRSIKSVEFIVDTSTGEICELRPPVKSSTTTFTIKYPND